MDVADPPVTRPATTGTAGDAERSSYRVHHGRRRPAVTLAGFVSAGIVLFGVFWRQSTRGTFVNSDGASNALQAWAMLHGNVLLHGWALADVSFYTIDLPEYVAVEAVRGLDAGVVHVCAALTYTALTMLAAALAMGWREAAGRRASAAVVAATIMLAPQPGYGARALLLSPDHVATAVPLLALWLTIERVSGPGRSPAAARWMVPVTTWFVLTWVSVGDLLAEIVGALPLVLVCLFRAVRTRRLGWRASRRELSLAAAAALSIPAARLAEWLITALGGWTASPPRTGLVGPGQLPHHLYLAGLGILQLFGADVTAQPGGLGLFFALLHLTGLGLAAAGLCVALARFSRQDLIVQVLALAIVINLAGYVFTAQAFNIDDTREIAPVLPFGAVLAGRLLAGRLLAGRLRAGRRTARWTGSWTAILAGGLLASYATMLGYNATRPPVPAPPASLAGWLASHHLTRGLGGYWQSNAVTLASRGAVQVRAIDLDDGRLVAGSAWDASATWYDPASQYADFVVSPQAGLLVGAMEEVAGRPARIYFYDGCVIAEWHENLLSRLG
jgi:hypothetical protein